MVYQQCYNDISLGAVSASFTVNTIGGSSLPYASPINCASSNNRLFGGTFDDYFTAISGPNSNQLSSQIFQNLTNSNKTFNWYITCGYSSSTSITGISGTLVGTFDAIIVKFSSLTQLLIWGQRINGNSDDRYNDCATIPLSSASPYGFQHVSVGTTFSTNIPSCTLNVSSKSAILLTSHDDSGTLQWSRCYQSSVGGEIGSGLAVDSQNELWIVGEFCCVIGIFVN